MQIFAPTARIPSTLTMKKSHTKHDEFVQIFPSTKLSHDVMHGVLSSIGVKMFIAFRYIVTPTSYNGTPSFNQYQSHGAQLACPLSCSLDPLVMQLYYFLNLSYFSVFLVRF